MNKTLQEEATRKMSLTLSSDKEIFQQSNGNADNHTKGQHECQLSEGGEANLQIHFNECKKKAGHSNFIPFNIFSMEHLPEGHRDIDLYSFINARGDLTVRIGVNMVSPERPEFWPNTKDQYPFGYDKGNTSLRSGSGEISVCKFIDGCGYNGLGGNYGIFGNKLEGEQKTCPCEKCQRSDKSSSVWCEIFIFTSAHVVFDEIEARHTTCRLFFDEQDSPLVSIETFSVYYVNIEHDFCVLKYVTCEPLGNQLYEMDEHSCEMWKRLEKRYRHKSNDNLTFIVSHPHGCSKQVSIGHWMEREKITSYNKDYDLTKLTYTTSTCPGSSGAKVCCVGYTVGHVHCGTKDSDFNYSSIALF